MTRQAKDKSITPPKPNIGEAPFEYALSLVSGKWKLPILFTIGLHSGIRYGALRRRLSGITDKVLSQQLRQLEHCGLVECEKVDQPNLSSSYALTLIGMDFMPVLMEICRWGKRVGWNSMDADEGWIGTETFWEKLDEKKDIHYPTPVCRRIF